MSSWLRLAMVRRRESKTNNVVILVVDRMDFGMAEEKGLVVENKKSHHPDEMIKAPEGNARPQERLKLAIPDFDVT